MLEQVPLPVPDALDRRRARALSHPTAVRVLAAVGEAASPVTVSELADRLEVHPNTVRQHLQRLRDADLVIEETEAPAGHRGRPRLLYRPVPAETERSADPYEWLTVVLLEGRRSGRELREIARERGRTEVAADPTGDSVARLTRIAGEHGFHPRQEAVDGGTDLVLERCPIAAAASHDPATVCRIHLGLLEGAAEAAGGVEVRGIADPDPHAAGCRVRLRLLPES